MLLKYDCFYVKVFRDIKATSIYCDTALVYV